MILTQIAILLSPLPLLERDVLFTALQRPLCRQFEKESSLQLTSLYFALHVFLVKYSSVCMIMSLL